MKKLLLTFLLALYTIPALGAGEFPPKRYDYPFKGKVYVYNWRPGWCWNTPACAYRVGRECHIYRDPRTTDYWWKVVGYKHERAHCNGWPAHHPP